MLRISLISDGKAGDLVQLRGIADALAKSAPCEVTSHFVAPRPLYAMLMPYGLPDPRDSACISPPWPDIAIGSGRRAVASLRALKKRHPQTFIAFLKDPRFARDEFDFLWLPTHDRAQSDNMFKTATSPHGLSPAVLDEARAEAATRFPFQNKPRALVLLGGPTKRYDYTSALADRLSNMLTPSSHDYELMIVPSRRTPDAFIAALTAALGDAATYVWDRVSDNPYRQLMATADVIIAPGDSHNMASEALAPGAQVFVFEPEGTNRKLDDFRAELIKQGLAQIFTGLPSASALQKHAPYDATRLIADAMMESFNSRGAFHD